MEAAERWLKQRQEKFSSPWNVFYEIHLILQRGDLEHAETRLREYLKRDLDRAEGNRLAPDYLLARIKYDTGDYQEALVYCQSALQARRLLIGIDLVTYRIDALNLLSKIYEAMGEYTLALDTCEHLLHLWADADPGSALLSEVQKRHERLLNK